jgi:hypothetical protein
MTARAIARLFALCAGVGDVVTGVLLLLAPAATLRLMRATWPGPDAVGLRFVGAFVLGIGLVHVAGLALAPRGGARLRHFMEASALVRACVAGFVAGAIVLHALPAAWASVALTDTTFAIAQVALARRGAFDREP